MKQEYVALIIKGRGVHSESDERFISERHCLCCVEQICEKHIVEGRRKGSWSDVEQGSWKECKTGDKMVGWHHWLNGHKFEQSLGDGEGQGSLVCYSTWGHKQSHTTEQRNNKKHINKSNGFLILILFNCQDLKMKKKLCIWISGFSDTFFLIASWESY